MTSCTNSAISERTLSWPSMNASTTAVALDHEQQAQNNADDDNELPWSYSLTCYATQNLALASWIWLRKMESAIETTGSTAQTNFCVPEYKFRPFYRLRQWLDEITIDDRKTAHRLCKLIPAQCPFERDIVLFGKTLLHIPPMCKLNPFYNELVYLRFRAMSYLADTCGEDVSMYC